MRALIVAMTVVAGPLMGVLPAHAFHLENDFGRAALEGGGGGRYFTGAPASNGYECTVCHTKPARTMFVSMRSEPPGLVRDGRYTPDTAYRIVLAMEKEHRGLDSPLNLNSFVFEMVDGSGRNAGSYGATDDGCRVAPDADLIIARGTVSETRWAFEWVAPGQGTGAVTAYVAAVDGDGANGAFGTEGDPFHDDVFAANLRLEEAGNESPPAAASHGGSCVLAGHAAASHGSGLPVVVASLGAVLCVRRRRRGRGSRSSRAAAAVA